MKTILWQSMVMLMLLMVSATLKAQIGIGTNTPDTGVMLEIQSPKKGVLLPRVDDAQSADTVETSLLFDKKTGKFKYYDGKQWLSVNPLNPDVQDNVVAPQNLTVEKNVTIKGQATVETTMQINGASVSLPNATTVSAPNATVTGNAFVGYGTIPLGGIIMWSGTVIPDGWALCNGSVVNGYTTPNLAGRFVVGFGKNSTVDTREKNNPDYKIGDKGGINQYSLSIDEMPKHKHDVKDLGHTHSFTDYGKKQDDVTHGGYDSAVGQEASVTNSGKANISEVEKGNSTPHENRPPYYVLAFIMRVK